jgi:hypothetical protein
MARVKPVENDGASFLQMRYNFSKPQENPSEAARYWRAVTGWQPGTGRLRRAAPAGQLPGK